MSSEKISYLNIDTLLSIVTLGQIEVLEKVLINSPGLDVNEKDEDGNFAAIIAARRNDLCMLKLLTNYGARLDQKDGWGRTVRGWANKHTNLDMIAYIEQHLFLPFEGVSSSKLTETADNLSLRSRLSSEAKERFVKK